MPQGSNPVLLRSRSLEQDKALLFFGQKANSTDALGRGDIRVFVCSSREMANFRTFSERAFLVRQEDEESGRVWILGNIWEGVERRVSERKKTERMTQTSKSFKFGHIANSV